MIPTQRLLDALAQRLRVPGGAGTRLLAPLLALALARWLYQRQRRHLEQLGLHRQLNAVLADGHPEDHALRHRIVEEWHAVGEHDEFASIVYRPEHDLDELVPPSPPSNVMVLFIPGNPGIPHFYLPLMRDILRRFGAHHEIRGLAYAGHYMPWKNNGKVYGLDDHYEHKIAYLRQRLRDNPKLRLVVIGHSIGCYLALKILEAFPNEVVKLVFMQPTFHHIGRSAKGQQLTPVFARRDHLVRAVRALEFLVPMVFRQWLVRWAIGPEHEPAFQVAATSLVDRNVMRNVLHTAHMEMRDVREVNAALLGAHDHKALFVYSPVDGWLPTEFAQEFQLRFDRARHRLVPQAHAFMMDKHGSRDMAEHIARWIQDVMDGSDDNINHDDNGLANTTSDVNEKNSIERPPSSCEPMAAFG